MNEATQKTETPRPILFSEYRAIAVDMFRAQCPTADGIDVLVHNFESVRESHGGAEWTGTLTKQAAEYWLQALSDELNKAAKP